MAVDISQLFDWPRYWVTGDSPISYDGYFRKRDGDCFQLTERENVPCLILLGLPGLGKSSTVAQIAHGYSTEGALIDLGAFNSAEDLKQTLDIKLSNWISEKRRRIDARKHNNSDIPVTSSEPRCHLFLDSLDEGEDEIPRLVPFIGRYFGALQYELGDLGGLFVRIACRNTEIPVDFTEEMNQIWRKEKSVQVLHLAQLEFNDVKAYVKSKINDQSQVFQFLNQVDQIGVASLAAFPITLDMLLDEFQSGGTLPDSRLELYERASKRRVAESNKRRINEGRVTVTLERRIEIASRLAAVSIFSNRRIISITNPNHPSRLYFENAFTADELRDRNLLNEVREVMGSSLFASLAKEPNVWGWSHQSFAEYLAAKALSNSNNKLSKLQSVVTATTDGKLHISYKMVEVAVWLAEIRDDFHEWVFEIAPQLALRRPYLHLKSESKKRLIDQVLKDFSQGELANEALYSSNLEHLCYPDIGNQLRQFIGDKGFQPEARIFALQIAKSCRLSGLGEFLVQCALDATDDVEVRTDAIHTLIYSDYDGTDVSLLKALIIDPRVKLATEDMQVLAMQLLWPRHITVEEYFDFIGLVERNPHNTTASIKQNLMDTRTLQYLDETGLITALQWVGKQRYEQDRANYIGLRFVTEIMRMAWQQLDDERILESFAHAIWVHAKLGNSILKKQNSLTFRDEPETTIDYQKELLDDMPRRRRLLSALAHTMPQELHSMEAASWAMMNIQHNLPRLMNVEDFTWLMRTALGETDQGTQFAWLTLAHDSFHYLHKRSREYLARVQKSNPEVIEAVGLDKLLARQKRHVHLIRMQNKRDEEQKTQKAEITKQLSEELTTWLDQSAEQDDDWIRLSSILRRSQVSNDVEFLDITKSIFWASHIASNADALHRVKSAALRCVKTYVPRGSLDSTHYNEVDFIAYYALLHISLWDLETLLTMTTWQRWIDTILDFRNYTVSDTFTVTVDNILQTAFEILGDSRWTNLNRAIANGLESYKLNGVLRVALDMQATGLYQFLEDQLGVVDQNNPRYMPLLRCAMKLDVTRNNAIELAVQIVLDRNLPEAVRHETMAILCNHSLSNQWWDLLWPIVSEDKEWIDDPSPLIGFGRENPYLGWLNLNQLQALYFFAAEKIKYENDITFSNGEVPWRYRLQDWRETILLEFARRGIPEAVEILNFIEKTYPHPRKIARLKHQARERSQSDTWISLLPREVVTLVMHPEKTLVRDSHHLLRRIIECLIELEHETLGSASLQQALWHKQYSTDTWIPTEENSVSDHLAQELRRRLTNVFVNREVEVRQRGARTTGIGDAPDILVQASSQTQANATVIIEVKCSWHDAISTFVQAQLVDRYLEHHNQCDHGLALVVHFSSAQWDPQDDNRRKTMRWNRASIEASLFQQIERIHSSKPVTVLAQVVEMPLR